MQASGEWASWGEMGNLEQETQQPLWDKVFSRGSLEGSAQASALGSTGTEGRGQKQGSIFWQKKKKDKRLPWWAVPMASPVEQEFFISKMTCNALS